MIQLQFGELDRLTRLGEKLTTIPGCPRTQGAVDSLVEDLGEICDDWAEAEWLVKEARSRWDDWRGRKGLIDLLDKRRRPELPPSNQAQELGPKPEVYCKTCDDWGHYFDPNLKKNVRCSCLMAETLTQTFLDALNKDSRRAATVLNPTSDWDRRRITQDEIDKAFQERQNAVNTVVADARSVLADDSASSERKEIARETLKALGMAETEVSA